MLIHKIQVVPLEQTINTSEINDRIPAALVQLQNSSDW